MSSGSISAQKPASVADSRARMGILSPRGMWSRLAWYAQVATSASAIISPGTMPAMNSLVMEMLLTTPSMTNPMDGGMTGAMMPPDAMRPDARGMS
ncbi:hypothetical protein D3C71_1869470 [compost metagenome]